MKRIMFDLETLGTDPAAHVLSIGWAIFDEEMVKEFGQVNLRPEGQEHRTRSFDTVLWWVSQAAKNPASAHDAFAKGDECGMKTALSVVRYAVSRAGDGAEVWANSPSFDLAILRDMFQSQGSETPWPFYMERDYRTVKAMRPPTSKSVSSAGTPEVKHTAEGDAVDQARQLLAWEIADRRTAEHNQFILAEAEAIRVAQWQADGRKAGAAQKRAAAKKKKLVAGKAHSTTKAKRRK
jgi:hypothetical protein